MLEPLDGANVTRRVVVPSDPEACARAYAALHDWDGGFAWQASAEECSARGLAQSSAAAELTYGHITYDGVAQLLSLLDALADPGEATAPRAFMDVGSGVGTAVFAAALLRARPIEEVTAPLAGPWIDRIVGVEVIGALHERAAEILFRRWDDAVGGEAERVEAATAGAAASVSDGPADPTRAAAIGARGADEARSATIELIRADIAAWPGGAAHWRAADVVFANSLLFGTGLMAELAVGAIAMRPGARLVTVRLSCSFSRVALRLACSGVPRSRRGGRGRGREGRASAQQERMWWRERYGDDHEKRAALFATNEVARVRADKVAERWRFAFELEENGTRGYRGKQLTKLFTPLFLGWRATGCLVATLLARRDGMLADGLGNVGAGLCARARRSSRHGSGASDSRVAAWLRPLRRGSARMRPLRAATLRVAPRGRGVRQWPAFERKSDT